VGYFRGITEQNSSLLLVHSQFLSFSLYSAPHFFTLFYLHLLFSTLLHYFVLFPTLPTIIHYFLLCTSSPLSSALRYIAILFSTPFHSSSPFSLFFALLHSTLITNFTYPFIRSPTQPLTHLPTLIILFPGRKERSYGETSNANNVVVSKAVFREVESMRRLSGIDSNRVVALLDVFTEETTICLVMEYLQTDVQQVIRCVFTVLCVLRLLIVL
jgi:hypothetical protein